MKKETKIFLLLIIFATFVVVSFRYTEYIIHKNFILNVNMSCNPSFEICFVSDCSPENDPKCDVTPYKKIKILDSIAPQCLEEHTCAQFLCSKNSNCLITNCSLDNVKGGEKCIQLSDQQN